MNINPDNEQPVCLYRCLCTRVDHRGGMVVEGVSSGGFPFVELGLKETKRFPFRLLIMCTSIEGFLFQKLRISNKMSF